MTTIALLPKQNYYGSAAAFGMYGVTALVVALVGFGEGVAVGFGALAIHLVLTAIIATLTFRWLWGRYRQRWTPTVARPPEQDAEVVLEGRIGAPSQPFRSPFSGTSCVAWGLVDNSGGGDSHQRFRWVMRPFVLEDPRGGWKVQLRPSFASDRGGPDRHYMPDVSEATYLDGQLCPADRKREIDDAIAALPDDLRWPGAILPEYGFELRQGDSVVLRGRMIPTPDESGATHVLEGWSIERGTAEQVVSRRGHHWYMAWGVAVMFGSFAAIAFVGLGAWLS